MNCQATWEDEDNNRQIEFTVKYREADGKTVIENAIPTKVSFTCPESKTNLRSIGVWTETGREMLSQKFQQSPAFGNLVAKLEGRSEECLELTV